MRRGNGNGFLRNGQGKFVGIDLGSDHCSEHEWGIKKVKEAFGIKENEDLMGIERRRIQTIPENFSLVLFGEHWTLVFKTHYDKVDFDSWDDGQLMHFDGQELSTAWSDHDFAVRVYSCAQNAKKNQKNLETLFEAMVEGKAAIWLGGGGVFQNAGLVIAIIDRCPKDKLKDMEDADIAYKEKLYAAQEIEEKINLTERLKAAGRKWIALSPKIHVTAEGYNAWRKHTVFDIVYWLNPMDQRNNHYGHVTVEDLLAWEKNEGPITHNTGHKTFAGGVEWHVQKGVYGK
jgi:hypothetical protein